jgi:iron(III) transport system permease protein
MGPELEEASSAAGAGWFDYFSRILLPLLRPTLFSVAIVVFISGIRDIPTVIFLATHESRTLSLLMLDYLAEANSRRQLCCWVCFFVCFIVALLLLGRFLGFRRASLR